MTVLVIFVLLFLTILITHKYTLVFLAQKYLKENNIEYSKVEGTLFDGVILHDVKYKDIMQAQKIQLNYKLLSFIKLEPIIKNIQTQRLYVDIDKLPKNAETEQVRIIPFLILRLQLKESTFVINHKKYFVDLRIKNLLYDDKFHSNDVSIVLDSFYAKADIQAKIIDNRLVGHSDNVAVSAAVHQKYLHFLKKLPKTLGVDLDLDTKRVLLKTHIPKLQFTSESNITLYDQNLQLSYLFDKKYFILKTAYTLGYKEYLALVEQNGSVNLDGKYTSKMYTKFVNFDKNFPFKGFDALLTGDTKQIHVDANASDFLLSLDSDDYKKYQMKLQNKRVNLSFFSSLPRVLREHQFALQVYSSLSFAPLKVEGVLHTTDTFANISGTFHYRPGYKQLAAKVAPKKENALYKDYNLQLLLPMQFNYTQENNDTSFVIDANKFQCFVHKDRQNKIEGYGNFASALFSMKGDIDIQKHTHLKISTVIPSIRNLLKDLNLSSQKDKTVYDGEVHIKTRLHIKDDFSVSSTINAPYLSAKTDSQNRYVLKNVLLHTSYKKRQINIYNYKASYKAQQFYSDKLSQLHVDHNLIFYIDHFYLYNNLLLKGTVDPLGSKMQLNLHSEKFHLLTKDIDVFAKTNININVQNTQSQKVDGNITLLSGKVSYQPQHDYTITDDDIIIVQDMKKQKRNNLSLHLNITANKPLKYQTKEINVHFIPQIVLRKEPKKKIKIYGKLVILDGSIMNESKEFRFDKSELIFLGKSTLNPELNLKLHYQTIDYKDIVIFISNTLDSPVLVFSSTPAMSQNDIMSYILFDEPADTLFDNTGATNRASINYLLLGTGIKTIFNQTTGVHVDTLNILNNANGTLGYEVGARLNKKIRVVYKNDTSSSMILQYNLGKSLRVDVDVHDTGQGVYFIYTKDFKGF
jgi:hypothetical protein